MVTSLGKPGTTPPTDMSRMGAWKLLQHCNAVGLEKDAGLMHVPRSNCQMCDKSVSENIGSVMEIGGVISNHTALNSSVCWSLDGVRLPLHIV